MRAAAGTVAEQFALFAAPEFRARYNIAPMQPVAAIRLRGAEGPERECVWLRWGLAPSWAKDPAIGNSLINARCETAAAKPAFRAAFRRRRCLVPADGFYEWQRTGGRKQPYFFHRADDHPFAIAGLWELWEGPDHAALETCTLLTTAANGLMRPIHDRMPVILPPEAYSPWLDPTVEPAELQPWLAPPPDDALTVHPVGALVNSPRNDDPRCIARTAPADVGPTLFE